MVCTPVPTLPPVTRLAAPCPWCRGELSVYVFAQATGAAMVAGGMELTIKSHHHLGPHACYPAASGHPDSLGVSAVDDMGWVRSP